MKANPDEVIDALTSPKPLTLGKLALLERISSPLLVGNYSRLEDNLRAVWIYRTPTSEAAKNIKRIDELSAQMGDDISLDDYHSALLELLGGITEFFKMLPRPDEDSKKKPTTGTGGSLN